MSATASPSITATESHCAHVFFSIERAFQGKKPSNPTFPHADVETPFFVTLKKEASDGSWHLRGCIGSLSKRPLRDLGAYALKSAFEDKRFEPLKEGELKKLRCSVSLLVDYEHDLRWDEWTPGTHGVIISFMGLGGKEMRATYLPEVAREMGWNQKQAIDSLIQKSGWKGPITDGLRDSIRLTRYQSSKTYLKYTDFDARRHEFT